MLLDHGVRQEIKVGNLHFAHTLLAEEDDVNGDGEGGPALDHLLAVGLFEREVFGDN
jgi:hypothetical protein